MSSEVAPVPIEERQRAAPPSVVAAKSVGNVLELAADEETFRLMQEAFGSLSPEFTAYALGQIVDMLTIAGQEECTVPVRIALAIVAGIAPTNEAEALLAVQMVCAHHAAADMTRRAMRADRIDCKQTYANLATKFSRTYLAQMEGLAKIRRGGEQVVKHVHVNEGGQAVIAGTVNTRGGG